MARGSPVIATALILMMIASTCLVAPAQAEQSVLDEIEYCTLLSTRTTTKLTIFYPLHLGKMRRSRLAHSTDI